MKIDIYTHTTMKSPRERNGVCIYVIETKELPSVTGRNPITEMGPIEDVSVNEAQLTTLLRALKRLKGSSEVRINTDSGYIKQGVEHLNERREAGWVNSRGQEVKFSSIWQQIGEILNQQESVSVAYEPINEYSSWMEAETEREKIRLESKKR